jgi:hypothetical protein
MYLSGPQAFRRLFSESTDFARQVEFKSNAIATLFFVSILPVVLHKRIYWLRNYTSKKSRILWGLGWILLPSNLLAFYFQNDFQRELGLKYEFNRNLFKIMVETGDINVCNPYQEWTDY